MNETTNLTPAPAGREEDLTPEQLAAQWESEAPRAAGPVANLVSSAVAVVLGAAGLILSLRLGLGTPSQPQPGLWPFVMSLVIAVLGLAQMVIGRHGGDGEKFSRLSWLVLFGTATLVGLVALMPVIGFEIPSLLLCFVWMKFLGGESWRSAALYSVLVIAAFYGIFILGLGTTIPHLF
ncbi:tripartite tricarboxylate transporter TctB family protein [Arthrobacter mobilis]|uniref:Tripartite tricarboxylate transporter TctB family protein n=1 Tax=Arthrobacter mobilis TaxID=2724944 RepID=A0A7X6HCX4_9MICC|nr:tripartite tricarboxylate transporter TctB family protein [Arthrobacter mobilis]NKX54837.1 tripartite tricarboxylate transporter TctB family protein [Arthrobacter mobilis]